MPQPTVPNAKRKCVIIKNVFSDDELAVLERMAHERGTDVAGIVALALDRFIATQQPKLCRTKKHH